MFYLHDPVDIDEIINGVSITVNLGEKEFHCTCPSCGKGFTANSQSICDELMPAEDGESVYCPACSEKLRAKCGTDPEDDYSTADMLIEDLIDKTRDVDGAQNFVYLRDLGVVVDIERCKIPELLDAVTAWANKEKADLEASRGLCQKRIAELEKTQYRLVWEDGAGETHEEFFSTREDAQLVAKNLLGDGCGVSLLAPDGSRIELCEHAPEQ